jgi:hypothetical protein
VAHSSQEAGNDRRAKGPQWEHAESDEQTNRLNDKRSTTEQAGASGPAGTPGKPKLLPPKVAALRQKLAQKAKQEPQFRFYSLYGGVMDKDTLLGAWWKVCSNGGAPGIDGISIEQIVQKEKAVENLLEQIQRELRGKTYRPQPGQASVYPQSQWKDETPGHPDGQRSRRANGGAPDFGADLRSRL